MPLGGIPIPHSGGGGGFTFVNATQQNAGASSVNTLTYTCTAGDFLWVDADTASGSATVAITVSGNTVVPVTGQTNIATATAGAAIDITATNVYVTSCSGGSITITATATSGGFGQMVVQEYAKGGSAGVLDNAGTPVLGASGGQALGCSATSTAAGELLIANILSASGQGPWGSPPTGLNLRTGTINAGLDLLPTTAGTNVMPLYFGPVGVGTISFCAVFK